MQATWTVKNHEFEEGLEPGSKTFRILRSAVKETIHGSAQLVA